MRQLLDVAQQDDLPVVVRKPLQNFRQPQSLLAGGGNAAGGRIAGRQQSIEPLRRLFRFSLAGLAARVAVVAVAGAGWYACCGDGAITAHSLLSGGVFVLQRVLFGLVIPVSLAYFTWHTIEMRSTQSATGILYVVVFLTLVGEALSVYLSLSTAVPL